MNEYEILYIWLDGVKTLFAIFPKDIKVVSSYGKVRAEMTLEEVKEWFDRRDMKTEVETQTIILPFD